MRSIFNISLFNFYIFCDLFKNLEKSFQTKMIIEYILWITFAKFCMNFKSYRLNYQKEILQSRTVYFCHLVRFTIATCITENKK